jgi:hypothetical protein
MSKRALGTGAAAILMLTALANWNAEAMPLVTAPKHSSPVEAVGCNSIGACPLGMQKVCSARRCWCASCGVSRSVVVVRPYAYRRTWIGRPVARAWRWSRWR